MRFKAKIKVVFKDSVLEPKGEAVKIAMQSKYSNAEQKYLLDTIKSIRIGSYSEIIIEEKNENLAKNSAKKIAEDFLCNSVIEKFQVQIEKI